MVAARQLRFAWFTTAKRPAFREQFGAGGAVNRAIHSASAKKRFVRSVHNRIDI
jgi:hypothetical protein